MTEDGQKRSKPLDDLEGIGVEETDQGALDAAMREAVAAVEAVESRKKGGGQDSPSPGEEESSRGPGGASSEVERLQQEVASLKDVSLRTLADFDNFRKRSEKEKQETRRYALVEPMRDFLPVIDNLERALAAGGSAEDLKIGVELILKQMLDLLQRFRIQPVAAVGERFDPTVHEAVMQEEDPKVAEPTVQVELQKGYILHDRLLRPAMVKVAMPPAGAGDPEPPPDEG